MENINNNEEDEEEEEEEDDEDDDDDVAAPPPGKVMNPMFWVRSGPQGTKTGQVG